MRTTKAQLSAHSRSLISAFVVHCLDSIIPLIAIVKISRPYLASLAEQAGLSLTWLQTRRQVFSWHGSFKSLFMPCMNIEADQLAHPCSLISIFIVCCLGSIIPIVAISDIPRLLLASVVEQTDLSLLSGSATLKAVFFFHEVVDMGQTTLPTLNIGKSYLGKNVICRSIMLAAHQVPSHG